MADIEIVYRVGYCYCECSEYDRQCHTQYGEEVNCRKFSHPPHEENVIPYGDCVYAKFEYRYKGWTGKKYDIEEVEDNCDPHLNCMLVKLNNKDYECEKVILNGKCIYNIYDEEGDA